VLFNSYEFIFAFLPISFFVYFYLNSLRLTIASRAFLVFASLFFYSWWNIVYLPLIVVSIVFNYIIGTRLSKSREYQKAILSFGVIANVLLLGYF
jgi:D-alanyl-lipoteichoic acid acyltransferase DltB (MBOAT superfamily)